MKHHVRLLKADPWVGVRKYDGCNDGIGADIDPNNYGDPVTGLTENYYTIDDKGRKVETAGTRVGMERILGLEAGTLKSSSPYWENYSILVGTSDLILDDDRPRDLLALTFIRAQSKVATSLADLKKNSAAEYVIFNPADEAKENVKRQSTVRKANNTFEKLTKSDRAEILSLYGVVLENLDPNMIESRLYDEMEGNPTKFLAIVTDPARKNKQFMKLLLHKAIITIDQGVYYYGEKMLGTSEIDCVYTIFQGDGKALIPALEIALGQRVDRTLLVEKLETPGLGGYGEVIQKIDNHY